MEYGLSALGWQGEYGSEVLNAHLFDDLDQVREITADWLIKYNEQRPHESLGNLPPSDYRRAVEQATNSLNSVCA